MKRVLNDINDYNNRRAYGNISKHDIVITRDGHLITEDIVVGSNSNCVINGENPDNVNITTKEKTGEDLNINIKSDNVKISNSNEDSSINISSDNSMSISSNAIDIQAAKITVNGCDYKEMKYYEEKVVPEIDEETQETKIIGISSFDVTTSITVSNVLEFIPTDISFISSNSLKYVKLVGAVTGLGLKDAKDVTDRIKMGETYEQTYATKSAALQAYNYAHNYTDYPYSEWSKGLKIVIKGSEEEKVDDYRLLYKKSEVLTRNDIEDIKNQAKQEIIQYLIEKGILLEEPDIPEDPEEPTVPDEQENI